MNREPDPEDLLFATDADPQVEVGAVSDGDWETDQNEWDPVQDDGDLEGLLAADVSPTAPPTAPPPTLFQVEERPRCLLPEVGEEISTPPSPERPRRGGDRSGDAVIVPRSGGREALPTAKDSPVNYLRHRAPSRSVAWVLPSLVLLLGVGVGAYVYIPLDNPVLGSIAAAFSVVGSLFLRVLLKA